MNSSVIFDGFDGILRVLLIAPVAYASLIVFLRVAGKRTLTKLNAFDLVVTVALGSTLATQILSRDVPLADGIVAFAALIGLQWAVTFTSVRIDTVRKLTRSEPSLVVADGVIQRDAMRRERITESEILQAIRSEGGECIDNAKAVYLQSDGSFAVIRR